MFFRKGLVSDARHDKLILSRLTPIYLIISVEKAPIVDHKRHFISLVRDDKVTILINRLNLYLLVELGQYFLLVLKELNELFRH